MRSDAPVADDARCFSRYFHPRRERTPETSPHVPVPLSCPSSHREKQCDYVFRNRRISILGCYRDFDTLFLRQR